MLCVLDGEVGAEHALLGKTTGQPGHPGGAFLVHAPHHAADGVLVELCHRAQRAIDVPVRREHLARGTEACAQVVAGVQLVLGVDQPGVPGAGGKLSPDSVEEPGSRPEDRVHGRARHASLPRQRVDHDRLGRRRAQPLEHGVDDPHAGPLGLLGTGVLFVRARHGPIVPSSDIMSDQMISWPDKLSDERREMLHEEFEVVVVGAGPAGLTSAITLGRHGIHTLVVERRPSASTLPRATVASTATMEVLRRFGLEDAAWERSIDVEWQAWACTTLAAAEDGHAVEVGLPTRAQAALVSPTAPACLPQDELEPLLEEHLGSLPGLRLDRGVEVVGLERRADDGFVLTLVGPNGTRRIGADYILGADGVRSSIREALGIAADGDEGLADRLGVVFRAPIWQLVDAHRFGAYFVAHAAFFPAGKPDRWIFGTEWDAAREAAPVPSEDVERWIREAAGVSDLPITVERVMPITFGVELARSFRDGNAFLVGDAAHRVTPRGGTGLNAAIRDGFDIGWKLAWVLRGWADDGLLDSYERERRPVVEFNSERSARTDGSVLGTAIGLNADIGGRIPHVWVPRNGRLVSTLDLIGDGLTLFVGPEWDEHVASSRPGAPPVTVERLDAIAARGLGLSTSGSLLVRTDGAPVSLRNDVALFGAQPTPDTQKAA